MGTMIGLFILTSLFFMYTIHNLINAAAKCRVKNLDLDYKNRVLMNCVNHYAENGYSKAIKCLKEL